MVKVLDASALIIYLEKEAGYEKIKDLLAKAAASEKNLLISAVNWGEVYYILIRDHGLEVADKVLHLVETFPIDVVAADTALTKQAALLKATHKLPFADCFAAALAGMRKGELITADKDFKVVEDDIKVMWVA